ncbi:LOW QUALITY PROTEIN: protein rhomboid [Phlebotomus argentipes]|uniref:LOW QUALITY PROTEIN: protein rhomboid n=1 Tax=Phlebotomus argentipes TaxID=94469 RepID=UPI0028931A9C|nr:LOW QUALITY PROTEIN: protein rhomboid [Phlebotomus argentipes]
MAQRQDSMQDWGQQRLHQESIPLDRLDSVTSTGEETGDRRKARNIFNNLDRDGDGYLNIDELKHLIRSHQCREMPRGVARRVMEIGDTNGDGRLDFEEFYQLSRTHKWMLKPLVVRYCQMVVPSPHRTPEDAIGGPGCLQITSILGLLIYLLADGQYERSMTFCPPPLTMVIFSLVEIIMFLIDVVHLRDYTNDVNQIGQSTKGPAATLFIYNPMRRFEAWRFATYMFVHIGIMHLMMNLLVQIFLGIALELVHCWWRIALVYLAGVVAGSMSVSLATPTVYLAGASGGVYALITAHIATIIMNWNEMEYAIIQLLVFLIYIITDIGAALYRQFSDIHDRVSYTSHIGGAVAGLLVGIGVLRNLKVRPWEKKLWWAAVVTYILLMGSGICVHIFVPDHFMDQNAFV